MIKSGHDMNSYGKTEVNCQYQDQADEEKIKCESERSLKEDNDNIDF